MIRPASLTTLTERVLSSPLLLVVLLLAVSALAETLYEHKNVNRAPFIAGYDWASHRNTLLVVYPTADACSSCNLSTSGWAELGLKHRLDVLVIAAHPSEELKQVRAKFTSPRLTILSDTDLSTIQRFSNGDLIGGVRVYDGRILARQLGGTPSSDFLKIYKRS